MQSPGPPSPRERSQQPIHGAAAKPKLLDQVREAIRTRHYSKRTEKTYVDWIKRFIFYHGKRHPAEMGEAEVNEFLSHLAIKENVSASTQNQALSALLFLYRYVLDRQLGELGKVIRAKKSAPLPVVLTREEVKAVLSHLKGEYLLIGTLMYGTGMRLMECLRLRVKDVDFASREIIIREGKGDKDRRTMLPEKVKSSLKEHLERVKRIHERDLNDGFGRVVLPHALNRKYPNPSSEWGWQYAFPQFETLGERENRRARSPSRGRIHSAKSNQVSSAKGRGRKAAHVAHVETLLRDASARGRL